MAELINQKIVGTSSIREIRDRMPLGLNVGESDVATAPRVVRKAGNLFAIYAYDSTVVRYTIDGSEPTSSSPEWTYGTTPQSYAQNMTVKAKSFYGDKTPSATVTISLVVMERVATPEVSTNGMRVELSTDTEGATIYYKLTDGEYKQYIAPFAIFKDEELTAYATKSGMDDSFKAVTELTFSAEAIAQSVTAIYEDLDEIAGEVEDLQTSQEMQDAQLAALALTKADKNGVYPQMQVGLADNLKSPDGTTNSQPYFYRTTAGTASVTTGYADWKKINGNSVVWNQLVGADTTEVETISGHKYRFLDSTNATDTIITSTGQTLTVVGGSDMVIDLTKMFGAGNEPDTVAEFKALYPNAYYTYNAGEVQNVNVSGVKTVGFNLYTNDLLKLSPRSGITKIGTDEIEIQQVSNQENLNKIENNFRYSGRFEISFDCSTISSSSSSAQFGIYVVYTDKTSSIIRYTLPSTKTRFACITTNGKIVKSISFGMWAYSGKVKLTNICLHFCWSGYRNGEYEPYTEETKDISWIYDIKDSNENTLFPNGLCSAGSGDDYKCDEITAEKATKYIGTRDYAEGDESDTTLTTDGVKTNYPLETPIEVVFDEPKNLTYYADDFGTEEAVVVENAKSAPFSADTFYMSNLRDEVRNLQKNYISKESMQNFLTAFNSAGVGTISMTWNDTDMCYDFEYTAPS